MKKKKLNSLKKLNIIEREVKKLIEENKKFREENERLKLKKS
jgi:regulator of replication initiation timing